MKRLSLCLAAALTVAACGKSEPVDNSLFNPYADYGLFLSVLPPGQDDSPDGSGSQPHFTDQLHMYENLVFTDPGELRTLDDLVPAYFKREAFLPDSATFVTTQAVSASGRSATIKRDEFNVPHIFGARRSDVYFGTGYASAQDRLFFMDVLRHVGRGRLSDFAGATAANYAQDRAVGLKAAYDEQELAEQTRLRAAQFGADATVAQQDLADYLAGVNTYIAEVRNSPDLPVEYTVLNLQLLDFTERDIVAIATLIQALFASGGGGEHLQSALLQEIKAQVGDGAKACALWRDLRQFDDPEKPATTVLSFPTQSPPTVDEDACPYDPGFASRYPGAVLLDRGSLVLRDILAIQDCSADCPDFGGDVTDDPVSSGGFGQARSTPVAAWLRSQWAGARRALQAWVGRRSGGRAAPRLSDAERARARARALALVDSVVRGLARKTPSMSNAILVNAGQTEAGHPIAVFGPQVGYFAPQILLELSQHGGDVHVRGMSFAGIPYVLIGRGFDHAWSATSAIADIEDVRVLRLCDPAGGAPTQDSRGYLYNGQCRAMYERVDAWTAEYNAGAPPPGPAPGQKVTRHVLRAPDYGPIIGYATVGGAPVALALQRATFFGEVDSALPFVAASRNDMRDPQSFYETFFQLTGTFNWFYVDHRHIAWFQSGLLPQRAAGIHPDLPQWGDASYDWQQRGTGFLNPAFSLSNFLPFEAHPREQDPERGYFANWNNAPAPGFWSADNWPGYGPVHRSQMLASRLQAFRDQRRKHTPLTMVEIMEDAGTVDLRGQEILPAVLAVLDSAGPALTAAQQDAVNRLRTWVVNQTMRRDRDGQADPNGEGNYVYDERAAVVLMDRWWHTMIDSALPQIKALETSPNGDVMVEIRDDHPGPVGSAFIQGYYGYMRRALDMALGRSAHPYRQLKCAGTGALGDCRAALVASLQAALDQLPADPALWDGTDGGGDGDAATTVEQEDAIVHSSAGAAAVPLIHWVNRPTWQQVIQPTRERSP
jgi:acyl-homoserine lactone acylase PvdQ